MTPCPKCGAFLLSKVSANGKGNDLKSWCPCGYESVSYELYPHNDPSSHWYKGKSRAERT